MDNLDEQLSIQNLLAQVKGLPKVENATDSVESFLVDEEDPILADEEDDDEVDDDSYKSTSSSTVPDLVDLADSYNSCQVL